MHRRRNSVVTRLAAAVIGVAALAVFVVSAVGLRSGVGASERLLADRLAAAQGTRTVEVRGLLAGSVAIADLLGESSLAIDAVARFSDGLETLPVPSGAELQRERTELLAYLAREVVPGADAAVPRRIGPADLLPGTDTGVHLQHRFLVAADGDDPSQVVEVGDDDWSVAHRELHAGLRDVAVRAGADDLLLVDPNGVIVYSVAKSIELATSVLTGPTSSEAFASEIRRIATLPDRVVTVTDLAVSSATLGLPVWHVVAPISDGSGVDGWVALRFSAEVLATTLAGDDEWVDDGLGRTGEVLLVGADNRVRSDVRAHREDPAGYVEMATSAGTLEPEEAERVALGGTTALVAQVDGDVVRAAATGRGGTTSIDHLGRAVQVEYGPLGEVGAQTPEWVLVAQLTSAEATDELDGYRRTLLIVGVVVVVVVTFLAAGWASRLLRPIREVGDRLRQRSTAGAFDPDAPGGGPVPEASREVDDPDAAGRRRSPAPVLSSPEPAAHAGRVDEFRRIVMSFDAIDAGLAERRRATSSADAERRRLLHTLLPASVAARVEAGDRSVVDRVAAASIAVVVVDGGAQRLARGRLEAVLEVIDGAAAQVGAARVKMVGDSCFVAVGHDRPLFDHSPRAVAFARRVLLDLATDPACGGVAASVGVATGRVDVGLGGASRLVYDVWGETVTMAYGMARAAESGTIRVTAATRGLLPAELAEGADALPGDVWVLSASGPTSAAAVAAAAGAGATVDATVDAGSSGEGEHS